MALQHSVTFDEKVYALSKIVHQVKFRNNRSDRYTTSQSKHLRLLDDIALLLVTQSDSDVAAVSFEQRRNEIVFYYAKNRPATIEEIAYVENIKNLARSSANTECSKRINRTESIFDEVLCVCRPKILSRFNKLLRILSKLPPAARCFYDDSNGDLERHVRNALGAWYDMPEGVVEFVDDFLSHLSTLATPKNQPAPSLEHLAQIIRVAHATGSFNIVTRVDGQKITEYPVYHDKVLGTRMRLLGDYFGAVKRIVRNADSIAGRQVEIRMEQIVPQNPVQFCMPTDYLRIVNSYAIERRIPTISFDTLQNAYPNTTALVARDAGRTQCVTYTVHAECTVAMHMVSLQRPWEFVEIGCSKGSCWLCEQYLSLNTRLTFHVSNVNGKLQPGWTIPPYGDARVDAQLVQSIGDELEEIVLRSVGNMGDDSAPRSPSNPENEAKSWEAEREAIPTTGSLIWKRSAECA